MTTPKTSPLFAPAARDGFAGFYQLTYGASTPLERLALFHRTTKDSLVVASPSAVGVRPAYEVWDEDRLVALLDVGQDRTSPEAARTEHQAILHGVYVLPEYRGRGIARSLMELLAERLLDKATTLTSAPGGSQAFAVSLSVPGSPGRPALWRIVDTLCRELMFVRTYCRQYLRVDFLFEVTEPGLTGAA